MQLDETKLRGVAEGGELCRLPSGIIIERRRKHEPVPLDGLSPKELEWRTGPDYGSKFLPGTKLRQIVEMTAKVLEEKIATLRTKNTYNVAYDRPIGISAGKRVRWLRVVLRGGRAHAYPVEGEKT